MIREADAGALDGILALLTAANLPLDEVSTHLAEFLVAEREGEVVGAVGLERYGDAALLRSLVVRDDARGSGLGASLVTSLIERARTSGVRTMVLLTTTAADWFPRFGFAVCTRDAVPVAVTTSVEFTSACPASATVMQRRLD
jgi:amino-acid N-acetyltransferase